MEEGDKIYLSESKYHVRYSESFKRKVCEEYLRGGQTKQAVWKKYLNKEEKGRLSRWLRALGYEDRTFVTYSDPIIMPIEEGSSETLKKQIKALEKALQASKLEAEIYARMIKIAEDQFKIEIRKKSNTK